jgi:hypothetical protein
VTAPAAIRVRVTVIDTWDTVTLDAGPSDSIADIKRRALSTATGRTPDGDVYIVKYHGARILDERETVAALGLSDGAPLIVLPARRHPVR